MNARRVAFFTDSFHEVNGVALTSREFVNYASRQGIPIFSVHAGPRDSLEREGSVTTCEFRRGPVRWQLEHDLAFDFLFMRHRERLRVALAEFQPELVHITGPGDAGILGAILAYELGMPLVASWHTNLHEFAARRLSSLLRVRGAALVERACLNRCLRFYRLAKVLFAPNPELVAMLTEGTGKPAFLMERGIDTGLFSPERRERRDTAFTIGYVGRLSPEKNVRMLVELEQALLATGLTDYRFLVVGEGSERAGLRESLRSASLPGILRGEELARAYASMDAFVFPSATDTFGNVVLEAMASGVVPVVSGAGGPKFLVQPEVTGFVARDVHEFAAALIELQGNPERRASMAKAARLAAAGYSWDRVFERVHRHYEVCFSRVAHGTAGASSAMLVKETIGISRAQS